MHLHYKKIIHFLFPLTENERIVEDTTRVYMTGLLCPCTENSITKLLPYGDPSVKAAIHTMKFHYNKKAHGLLTAVLHIYMNQLPKKEYIAIPVPLSSKRVRARGYNQVTEVLRTAIKDIPHISLEKNMLVKHTDTVPQTTLTRKERLVNVSDAYSIRNMPTAKKKLAGKNILLIDDVTTTGATLKAAAAALRPLQPKSITCIALAH